METTKYYKRMKAITIVTGVLSLLWIYWTVGRTIATLSCVPLREGHEISQMSVAIGYCASALLMIAMQMIFLIKQMKNLKNGVLFDKTSTKYVAIWGACWVVYDLCSGNIDHRIVSGVFDQLVIQGTALGIPIIAFAFAILYRLAADIAEENNLTI